MGFRLSNQNGIKAENLIPNFIITADFEAETGSPQEFKKLASYIDKRAVECVNPICHIVYYKNKKGNEKYIITQTFLEFLNKSEWLPNDTHIAYHNLKYDFSIIIYDLLNNGWTQIVRERESLQVEDAIEIPPYNSFQILGDRLNKINGVMLYLKSDKDKDGFKTIILFDSYKVNNSSLENFAKSMEVENKGSYNFDNHINGTNHFEIIEYCKQDCRVLYKSLIKFYEKIGGFGITASGISLKLLKDEMVNEYLKKQGFINFENSYAIKRALKNEEISVNDIFRETFPVLTKEERFMSKMSYHGGYTYLNPKFKDEIVKNVIGYDINSSYPYQMVNNPLPYGKALEIKNIKNCKGYSEFLLYINVSIKNGKTPWLRVHRNLKICGYYGLEKNEIQYTRKAFLKEWEGYIILNSIDYKQLKKDYNILICEFVKGITFNTSKDIFKKYILSKYELKNEASKNKDEALKVAMKVLLNGLYGKFGQDITGEYLTYQMNEIKLDYEKKQIIDLEGLYTPIASAVTSYARVQMYDIINIIGTNNFIYGDTDSIYFKYDFKKNCKIQKYVGTNLGDWELDKICNNELATCKFLARKTYLIEKNGIFYPKVAGLPKKSMELITDFENFKIGREFPAKKSKMIYGGTKIYDTNFILKERSI
jgi:hypothetical protein